MAEWADILQEGKFDGVRFDFVSTRDEGSNELDVQRLPGKPGQKVAARARNGRRWEILGIFIEDDYPDTMDQLIAKLDNGGEPKEFVHPVFGVFKASCESWHVLHDVDDAADSATVQITLVEHTEDTASPSAIRSTTPARANAVRSAAADVLSALSAFVAATEVQNNTYVLEVTAAVNAANGVADELEASGDEMSALEVQSSTNSTLSTVAIAVDAGADYDSTEAYDLGAAVQAMAAAISDMANELIEAKPPLQTFTVAADTNLLTFVHGLYGNSERVDEVLQLNSVADPSLLAAGTKVMAYGV